MKGERGQAAGARLKSYEFRKEREAGWRELESLVEAAEGNGLDKLTSDDLLRLPVLYRAALSSLSVARAISLDQNVVAYLEGLATRAYFVVYGVRAGFVERVVAFFVRDFQEAVERARWHILAAGLVLILGVIAGLTLTIGNPDWFYTIIPGDLAGDRSPSSTTQSLRGALYSRGGGLGAELQAFASFLFTHNAAIGMMAFALGFAFGIPVVLLMFYNGMVIGSMAAVYATRSLSLEFWAWLCIHGTTEILAILLCGGAGFMLGGGLAFPGRVSRLDNLARQGRFAGRIVIGAVVLFFVAALLEGFGRQLILDVWTRYMIGAFALMCWAIYLLPGGQRRGHDRRG